MKSNTMNNYNGKILLATFAGISAGIIAGLLLTTDNGRQTRNSIKRSFTKVGSDLERTMKKLMDSLERNRVTEPGSSLVMHGTWDDVKGQLKQHYGELTDEDLMYEEGQEDELFGRLQRKLGKTKNEIMKIFTS